MLVVSQPILTSADEGPVRGALIMGRFLDRAQSESLAQAVGLPLETYILSNSHMPTDFQIASTNLSPQKPVFTQVTNETNVAGYVLLQDVSGVPIAITKVESYRSAYTQAKAGLNYLLASFVILGIAIFSITTILLDKFVLSRVSRLTSEVTKISENGSQQNYVTVKGNDELSNLGNKINGMVTAVKDSRDELKKYSETLENKVEERTLELKKSQEKLKSIFAASPDTILAVDLQYNITECNKQIFETSGYSREDLIGRPTSTFLSETDYKIILKRLENNLSASVIHVECNIIKKDKSVYPAELTIGPLRDAQSVIFGLVVMIRDLTETKELEKKLFKSERLAAIGELAGMVGHDLRNPLAAIKNAVYFIKKKGNSIQEEQAKKMLEIIDNGIIRSDKIINDLLEYARNMHLELEVDSVQNVLLDALSMVRIPENVTVINMVSDEPTFRVDKNKIERVFVNLIKNAADAMPNGGAITLHCRQVNDSVEIAFTDTGVGIPEEIRSKLFSQLVTTKAQGMGFGLAICKRIIEAHSGIITVESEEGKGAAFKVTLPVETKQNKIPWIASPQG